MSRYRLILALGLFATLGWLGWESRLAPAAAQGSSPQAVANPSTVIKTESNLFWSM